MDVHVLLMDILDIISIQYFSACILYVESRPPESGLWRGWLNIKYLMFLNFFSSGKIFFDLFYSLF